MTYEKWLVRRVLDGELEYVQFRASDLLKPGVRAYIPSGLPGVSEPVILIKKESK